MNASWRRTTQQRFGRRARATITTLSGGEAEHARGEASQRCICDSSTTYWMDRWEQLRGRVCRRRRLGGCAVPSGGRACCTLATYPSIVSSATAAVFSIRWPQRRALKPPRSASPRHGPSRRPRRASLTAEPLCRATQSINRRHSWTGGVDRSRSGCRMGGPADGLTRHSMILPATTAPPTMSLARRHQCDLGGRSSAFAEYLSRL